MIPSTILLLLPLASASALPQGKKLSAPLGIPSVQGDVEEVQLSPDGQWVVYLADERIDGELELFSAQRSGSGGTTRLNDDLVAGGGIAEYRIAPMSQRVVYVADQDADEVYELYSVPVAGGAPVRLSGPMVAGGDVRTLSPASSGFTFDISPDGQRVIYLADQDVDGERVLYTVPVDGSASPLPFFALGWTPSFIDARITPDSQSVVFLVNYRAQTLFELFIRPVDGSGTPQRLTPDFVAGGNAGSFELSPDGTRVVYTADALVNGRTDIFSLPLDLSAPEEHLNGSMVPGGDVQVAGGYRNHRYAISDDSQYVVYQADQLTDERDEVFTVPIVGGTSAVRVNLPLDDFESLFFRIAPGSARIAYSWSRGSLLYYYAAPIDGSVPPDLLSTVGSGNWNVTPDGFRLVYARGGSGLWSIPMDGSAAPVRLSSDDPDQAYFGEFRFDASSNLVIYSAGSFVQRRIGLHSVPQDGSASPISLSGLAPWGEVGSDFQVDSGGVVLRGSNLSPGVFEAQSVPVDGSAAPIVLNGPLPTGELPDEVEGFALSPDGGHAVYTSGAGLYAVSLLERGPVVRLSPAALNGGSGDSFFVSTRVLFSHDSRYVTFYLRLGGFHGLYRAPLDGSAEAQLLHAHNGDAQDFFGNLNQTPDGSTLVYTLSHWIYDAPSFSSIWATPADGSGAPQHLAGANLTAFLLSGDGQHVVFGAGQYLFDFELLTNELLSVPVDGSATAVRYFTGTDTYSLGFGPRLAANGTRVLYTTYDSVLALSEIHSAPVDGSSMGFVLDSPAGSMLAMNPADTDLTYLSSGAATELRTIAVGGGQAPVTLATLPAFTQVRDVLWTPDGSRAVFQADYETNGIDELFSVPAQGGAAPVKVNFAMVPGAGVSRSFNDPPHFQISRDGMQVVYRCDGRVRFTYELFASPITGGPATMLHNPLPGSRDILPDFTVLRGSDRVFYRGQPTDTMLLLWKARLDGSGTYRRQTGPPAHPNVQVLEHELTADERFVVYRGDEDTEGLNELFVTRLGPVRALAPPERLPAIQR